MDKQPKGTILSGYRILDLTDEKGMFSTRLLADMGAEVIRVEKPGARSVESAADFGYLNAGKRSISLDLEKGAGCEVFKRLVGTADVVVETGPPGYLASLGLGYPELSEINPRLVMAAVTDFGQSGPYRKYKSCDLVVAALGGWLSVCGESQAPLKPFGNQAYYATSLFATNGIMLALWHRHVTGKGQYLDISVMECVAATLDHVLVRYFYEGTVAKRQGSQHWNSAFRIFPCRDGYILLSLFQQWETLVDWLESEGMAEDLTDMKWRDSEARLKGLDHIMDVLEKWTLGHTVAELVETGQLMHFPWAGVTSAKGLLNSPQLAERNYFTEVEYPEAGKKYKSPGAACKLSRSPWQVGNSVPNLGEHNLDIYHRELGLSVSEIGALEKEGIV
jgi:crotonobetainyl-CoA:carnitine CoA-transferase CaiB-like acyl-CoA transferase